MFYPVRLSVRHRFWSNIVVLYFHFSFCFFPHLPMPEFDPQTSQFIFWRFPRFLELCARGVASTLAPLVEVRSRHTAHLNK